ncbi:MAG: peptide ABC transporter substrate-binding protein [Candidatus Velthaea sp.]
MRFADGADAQHLNTLLIVTYPETYPAQLTGAFLTRVGAHGETIPELAHELPTLRNGGISVDGKTITFHLRPNLRWSDGSALTASDAVFTAQRIIAKDSPVASTSGWDKIVDVASPHPGDLVFRLKTPYGPAVNTYFSTLNGYSILPEHLLSATADLRRTPFNDLPVGAGPFRYASFKRGDRIVMDANPYYFRGRPKLDRITYVFLPDENTLTTQILTGEIDIAIREQPTQMARIGSAATLSIVKTPSINGGYIGLNNSKPPFDDRRVRLALRLAIDRKNLLDTVYHGAGSISNDPVSLLDPFLGPGVPADGPDLARAADLLDQAGWRADRTGLRRKNGQPLAVDFVNQTGNTIGATITELVRAQWAKLGVTISSRTLDSDVVFAPDGVAARGTYGALLYGTGMISDELDGSYTCKAAAPHGFNYERYCNPAADALIARADASYEPALRLRLYLEARRLIAADAPNIPTIHRQDNHVIRPNVSGFRPNGLTIFDDVMDLDVR